MSSKGIIGFFDILGYQNIIENNQIEDAAQIIEEHLVTLPELTLKELTKDMNEDALNPFRERFSKIKSLIFSDTILLSLDLSNEKEELLGASWFQFLAFCAIFFQKSFLKGLPMRGVIDFGSFYISGNCFAGKSIIDSYKLGGNLNFSGCVFTNNAKEEAEKIFQTETKIYNLNDLACNFYAPLKDNSQMTLLLPNWTHPFLDFRVDCSDIRKTIFNSFLAYKKDIPVNVLKKIENTELSIQCLINRIPYETTKEQENPT